LPNKVGEWLKNSGSLALLVGGGTSQDPGNTAGIERQDDSVKFCVDDNSGRGSTTEYICRLRRVATGIVYMFQVTGDEEKELKWSESAKTWTLPTGRKVPGPVVLWLKQHTQQELAKQHVTFERFEEHFLGKPWVQTPPHVKRCLPREFDLAVLQQTLNHDFRNPMLLVEALTHASCGASATAPVTPSSERLVFLGSQVAELLIMRVGEPSLPSRIRAGRIERHCC
jgi:hypothetical protein